jgi:hypothetical protein
LSTTFGNRIFNRVIAMLTIDEQLRYFAVKVNNGSGCIYQPDSKEYTYVLTVKHNLEVEAQGGQKALMSSQEIKIYRGNVDRDPLPNIINYETHDTLDLALIIVPFIGDLDIQLTHSNSVSNEQLILYGYPNRLSAQAEKRENVRCLSDMQMEDKLGLEIRTELPQYTWELNSQKSLIGLSGSGVFADVNGTLVLKGIFPKLKDSSGANNKLILFHITNFNSIAAKLGTKSLLSSNVLSFQSYAGKAFNRVNPGLKILFSNNIEQISNSSISPIAIAERNKDKLTLPVSRNYSDNFSQSKLWEAWLELLTVLNIVLPENRDLEFYCSKVPLYFSANENHIKRLIKLFLSDTELRSQVKKNSLIAFASSETSGGKEFLSRTEVEKIVADLNRPDFFNDRMMIGSATQVPCFSCVHVDHFSTKIDQLDVDSLEPGEILDLIKQEIKNILNYAY